MGFSRQEYWTGLPSSPPEDPPDPGIEFGSFTSPALAGLCVCVCVCVCTLTYACVCVKCHIYIKGQNVRVLCSLQLYIKFSEMNFTLGSTRVYMASIITVYDLHEWSSNFSLHQNHPKDDKTHIAGSSQLSLVSLG